jgi:3-methyladenine DNA glycosylase AlkD
MSYLEITNHLKNHTNPTRIEFSKRYFPRGSELGNRQDLFYGYTVPETRKIAKIYQNVDYSVIIKLLDSNYHEQRLCGVMILQIKLDTAIKKDDEITLNKILNCYLKNLSAIDHWDLVDQTAGNILGKILVLKSIKTEGLKGFVELNNFKDLKKGFLILENLAKNSNIWHQRISIIASFAFIKNGNLAIPISICKHHINNKHHYIQKATGWVLREIGKYDRSLLDNFLKENIKNIHPICLSYSLEKHSKAEKDEIKNLRNYVKPIK